MTNSYLAGRLIGPAGVAKLLTFRTCTGSVGIGHLAVTVKPVPSTYSGQALSKAEGRMICLSPLRSYGVAGLANQGFSRHGGVLDYFGGFI